MNYNCKWSVFVLPNSMRWELATELGESMSQLVGTCTSIDAVSVYIDEGIIKEKELHSIRNRTGIEKLGLHKSHEVNGLQLADLVAALCGVRLREEISQEAKILQYGDESGFDPPIMAELGYELWASLRNSMHRDPNPIGKDLPEMAEFLTNGYGLFVSDKCPTELRDAAEKLFGRVYLDCIH